MKKESFKHKNNTDLRKKAEKKLKPETIDIKKLSEVDVRKLAHELQVHQIELEMQNDELRKAQMVIEESRQKYSYLYDFSPVGYFTVDENGLILEANLTGASMLSIERSVLIGKHLSMFIAKEDQDKYYLHRKALFKDSGCMACDLRMVRNDGTEFYTRIECAVAQDGKENSWQCRTVIIDITERKRIEKELERLNESLEQRVVERTAELVKANEEIAKMQRLESVGILAGGIAHDFNNYLQGILSNIAMAKIYVDPSNKGYASLGESEKAIIHAKHLTQQLLTFSKGGEPIKKVVSASELIKESVSLALSGSNIRCGFDLPDDLWSIEVDKGQMNQVFSNLLINADYAMSTGGTINIKVENIDIKAKDSLPLQAGRYVKITIEDQGAGIHEEDLHKIFDPYFTTKKNGSGLGLSIIYSIIKRHCGYISVESRIGVGTTFHVYLPASRKEILKEPGKSKNEGACPGLIKGKEASITLNGKILIMDDEDIFRAVIGEHLRLLKYDVEEARNGTEAIEIYKAAMESCNPFDAVILDLTIAGGMGGEETIKELLKIDSSVKAIVASGYSNAPIMSNFREYGFKGVVNKPYEIYELDEAFRNVIKGENE